jgi:hypothetical protein
MYTVVILSLPSSHIKLFHNVVDVQCFHFRPFVSSAAKLRACSVCDVPLVTFRVGFIYFHKCKRTLPIKTHFTYSFEVAVVFFTYEIELSH